MSLSEAQKAAVIFYLGYPATSIIPNSTDYSKILADRMVNLTAPVEAQVGDLLTKIAAMREKLFGSSARMLVKRVGDIELNTDEHPLLSGEHRRLLRDLSSLLGIPLQGRGNMVSISV